MSSRLLQVTPALQGPVARMLVTTEERRSHEEAVNRLLQIAAGFDAAPTFLEIGGWHALQRRVLAPLPAY